MTELPIERILPDLRAALAAGSAAVLEAPPGAGKTTRVPLALLDAPWLEGRRIVMLEPRRLAARAAATRMASLLGERVGGTVGYRIRLETRVGPGTRIEVVTEGVLTRMLQSDPALEGVGLVVFDEFHERGLHADLGLALVLEARDHLRPELRVLVMSATLDGAAVARLVAPGAPERPPVPIIRSHGRLHPVETRYLGRRHDGPIEPIVARTVLRALADHEGDVLVFLPGAREIRRVEARLAESDLGAAVRVRPLFGDLPEDEQERAIAPSPRGRRKVVLATAIAETSLTIEGVRVVIDSGRMRIPRFSARTGMTRLETATVSRASADQRRGRAGRLGPGVCYRLWTEAEDRALAAHRPAEILEADLAPLVLDLAAWGVDRPDALRWLDPPPAAAFAQARELLTWLGALDDDGRITDHGRAIARLGMHPRLAHMLLRGAELGLGALACDVAALLGGRDILRRADAPADPDLRLRLDALAAARRLGRPPRAVHGHDVHAGGCGRALREAAHGRRALGIAVALTDPDRCGLLLAFAYPDRIARRRPGDTARYLLRNGRGAALPDADPLGRTEWIVAASLDDTGRESRIRLAAPLAEAELDAHFGDRIERRDVVAWDRDAHAVRARAVERLGALTVREVPLDTPGADAVAAALLEGIRAEGLGILPWSKQTRRLRERMAFLRTVDPEAPAVSDAALLESLDDWLAPLAAGMSSARELRGLDLAAALLARLGWERRQRLDAWAPDRIEVPSGSRIAIDYTDPAAPVLAVRLQELFGLIETPRIADGRVPLTLHLLSPAHRPVQVTRDLASFWRTTYFDVRKDLKGRYPKHDWPDDPLAATPTRRVRPRR